MHVANVGRWARGLRIFVALCGLVGLVGALAATPAHAASTALSTTSHSSLSATSLVYGAETLETFTVTVTGHSGDGYPEGTVTMYDSSRPLCNQSLAGSTDSATAMCSLSTTELPASTYCDVFATFTPATTSSSISSYAYTTSNSPQAGCFTVAKDTTTTTVSESPTAIAHPGSAVVFTAGVTTQNGEVVPSGEHAVVRVDGDTCMATLTAGTGTCTIANSALGLGTYPVTDSYSGDANLAGSPGTSGSRLAVTKTLLTLTKTDGVSDAVPGDDITYTIVVSNTGPSVASNVVVTDTLPTQGLGDITTTMPAGVTFNSGTDTWNVGSLASGSSATLTLTGIVPSNATGDSYVNTATASASDATTVTASDSDTLMPEADLTLTKTDGVSDAVPGDDITYTIVVSNTGPSVASNVVVTDTLPTQGLGDITTTMPAGVTFNSGTDTWNVGTLASGASDTLTLTALVSPSATGSLTNTATASASDATTVTASDTDTLNPEATLTITKTDDDSGVAVPGDDITYTVVVSNNGPSDATGLSANDLLPAGETLVSSSGPGSYNSTTGVWSVGTLASGASDTLTLTALVSPSATGSLTNTATASASDATTVTASDTDTLRPEATLSITKTDDGGGSSVTDTAGEVTPGTDIIYIIVVSNNGPSDATGLSANDLLPAGETLVSSSGPGSYNSTTGVWSVGTLASGASDTLTLTAFVSPSATGSLTNTATASASDATTVTASDTDTLRPEATLSITKTDDGGGSSVTDTAGEVTPGTDIIYIIVVSNNGPSDATGLSANDLLPAGETLVSSSGPGSYNSTTGVWSVGTLASGASDTLTLTALVSPSATGTLTNTATASASDATTVTATDTDFLPASSEA